MTDQNFKRGGGGGHQKSNYVGVIGPKLDINLNEINDLADISNTQTGAVSSDDQRIRLDFPGVLFVNSEIGFGAITDGSSNTFCYRRA